MAFFTPGNLITLAIVVLLLLFFRQIDRGKRPLEMLRKYADKIKDDLAAYAAEKEEAVKSYGVSLDVEQQAARELMKRLQLNDQELSAKAASLAKIDERIHQYDSSLEELVTMTARVQENLDRLKEESRFVEDTSSQVRGLKEKLGTLEKDLGKLEQRFERENAVALEQTQAAFAASFKSILSGLEAQAQTIERKVDDHREIIGKIEAERAEHLRNDEAGFRAALARSLEEAGRRADKLEDAVLIKLQEQARERVEKLKTALDERIKTCQENAKIQAGELQEILKQQRFEAKAAAAEFAAGVRDWEQQWRGEEDALTAAARSRQEDLRQCIAEGDAALESFNAALAGHQTRFDSGLEDLSRRWTTLSQNLETSMVEQEQKWLQASQDMDAASARQWEQWRTLASGLERTLETQREAWNTAAAAFETTLAAHDGKVEAALAAEWKRVDAALSSRMEDLERALSAQKERADAAVSSHARELEQALKTQKEQVDAAVSSQARELEQVLKTQKEQADAAVSSQARELEQTLNAQEERLRTDLAAQREALEALAAENRTFLETQRQDWTSQAAGHQETLRDQVEKWRVSMEEAIHQALEDSDRTLETYKTAQAGDFLRLESLSDDASRLERELRRLMEESESRVRGVFAQIEEEAAETRRSAAAGFESQIQGFNEVLDSLRRELEELKKTARGNVSENLKEFEEQFSADLSQRKAAVDHRFDAWFESLEQRLDALGEQTLKQRRDMETALAEETRKNLVTQGEKISSGLERLRQETADLEAGIREEMRVVDETRLSFREQLNRDMEELRLTAESSIKVEIGRYTLSAQESIKQNQRDLEEQLKEITEFLETRNAELRSSQDRVRELAEENDSRITQFRGSLDKVREEAAAQRQEIFARTQEEAKQLSAAVEEAERRIRDFTAQTALFDHAAELKTELERRIEDLRGDIDRLDQRKSEIAQMEGEFGRIRRLGDEVGAKMNRFLLEQRRVEVMEEDFNRLLQISQAVEEKLAQVSDTHDTLEAVQVQIRRLEDALREVEEKYQRVERKNEALEETSNGISRNFKALQDSEATLNRLTQGQGELVTQFDRLRDNIEALSGESEKARVVSEKLVTLDESLSAIETRIKDMQKAREWLAALETRMEEMYRQAQDHVKLAGDIINRDQSSSGDDRSALTPAMRENVLKLVRRGWTVKQISNSLKISEGAVELIMEFAPRDQ
jgi:chromosome segregation ATPase